MGVSFLNDEFFGRLEALAIEFRKNMAGFFGGKHRTRTYGQTVEFADYREYQLGDDIRRIDWNLYSRFEKYFLKLFTDERQMHCQIFLDCSASMGKDNPKKATYALGMAAAIAYLSIHNMDKVSIKLMRKNYCEDLAGTIVGKNTFFRAISQLENLQFDDETDIEQCILNTPNPGTNDGLSVIISDFLTESSWKKAVDFLSYRKRQVLLIQVLTPEEIEPPYTGRMHFIDCEAVDMSDPKNMRIRITRAMQMAYDEALRDFREELKSYCISRDADFITVRTDRDLGKTIFGELIKIGMIL